jgi:CelD/BcsL family acetyltransferase involved in cellulose biosynthesis
MAGPGSSGVEPAGPAIDVLPLDHPGWSEFVGTHPDATCYHRPQWSRLLADCYGYPGAVVVQRGDDGSIVAGMPILQVRQLSGRRRWVCLPFSDECGPLLATGGSAERLVTGADAARRRARAVQLEVRADVGGLTTAPSPVAVAHSHRLSADLDAVQATFTPAARRSIRKARKSGVEVREAREPTDADAFYGLHVRTRRRKGMPVQPHRYFRLLWERMIASGHGTLLLAEHLGDVVAGAVFLTGGTTVTYKYGASDPEHWPVRPNHAIMWHAMTWAVERHHTTFDWGRSDLEDSGLRDFKSSLGGRERVLRYTRLPEAPEPATSGRSLSLVRPVLRRSPAWVCRAAGEVLYRYAG